MPDESSNRRPYGVPYLFCGMWEDPDRPDLSLRMATDGGPHPQARGKDAPLCSGESKSSPVNLNTSGAEVPVLLNLTHYAEMRLCY